MNTPMQHSQRQVVTRINVESLLDLHCRQVMNLNINKVFTITQKALPLLRAAEKKDGVARVINVSLSW
jgi:NAD(P)-dependent dehydrogenase (short-subunit alcohol dehydrogenase family)